MPTYEYRCPEGHLFEHFVRKISDSVAELPCPQCGKMAARQLSAGAGLVFKGSGFYLTDYGKNAHRKGEPAAKGESKGESRGESSGGGESKSESAGGGEGKSSESKPAESKPSSEKSEK